MYDVVLVSNADDLNTIDIKLPYIIKNLHPQNIVIISSKNAIEKIKLKNTQFNVVYLDEDELISNLTIQNVKNKLREISGTDKHAGWYFQQFLKMGYAYITTNDYYLIWDADTIPLNKIDFLDSNLKPLFTIKTEYAKSYFNTLKNILGYDKIIDGSFIAEHMIVNKLIMQEMIENIVNYHFFKTNIKCTVERYWEIILENINPTEILGPGFSEFETYGTYVTYNYPDKYNHRTLRTYRDAAMILGMYPSDDTLQWAANDYDIVTFEEWSISLQIWTRISQQILKKRIPIRFFFRMKNYILLFSFIQNILIFFRKITRNPPKNDS